MMGISQLPLLAGALLCMLLVVPSNALHAYGHAYSRPDDFTPAQLAEVASRFPIFTVEKCTAANVYGNASAKAPFKTNSIAATVGTAKKIKALNDSVKVLMYWNSELFFNFYECEAEVQPDWTFPNPNAHASPAYYNYSVPAFRAWWVKCVVSAIKDSDGLLDGVFLDATPKLSHGAPGSMAYWQGMVDQIKTALGPNAIVLNNGFYLTASGVELSGEDAWSHTRVSYVESMTRIGTAALTPARSLAYLQWLANESVAHPDRLLVGHGSIEGEAASPKAGFAGSDLFTFSLARYLLITSSVENGYFLANNGSYSITGGLLNQPTSVYSGTGVGCGEPTASFERVGGAGSYALQRRFQHGMVKLDIVAGTASIDCGGEFDQRA